MTDYMQPFRVLGYAALSFRPRENMLITHGKTLFLIWVYFYKISYYFNTMILKHAKILPSTYKIATAPINTHQKSYWNTIIATLLMPMWHHNSLKEAN